MEPIHAPIDPGQLVALAKAEQEKLLQMIQEIDVSHM
jgi:hypothetical protein